MINVVRKLMIFLVLLFVISLFSFPKAIAYWDIPATDETGTALTLGAWNFYENIVDTATGDMDDYIDDQVNNQGNTEYNSFYTQSGMPGNQFITIEDIELEGYLWDITGKVKNGTFPTLGYVSIIDRVLDNTNTPIHDINTEYFAVPPFPEYNYFVSYDSMNSLTNNRLSLRLNYNSRMTSTTTLGQVTNVSFYSAIGLADVDDDLPLRNKQAVVVEVSFDGITWKKIGSKKPPFATTDPSAFTFYSFDVPATHLGQDLYVQIRFNGRARTVNSIDSYSRAIIDDLKITFN